MTNLAPIFHRPELAKKLADQILVTGAGSAAGSGVFLAAPRRTGKSTFVREDLRPALEMAGALVVYADLWANPTTDPGAVITNAIRSALVGREGVILRLAKSAGMNKISVGNLSFDLDRIGLGQNVSLTDALAALSDETGGMIVLVIDEAQHAMTTDVGNSALFALKAARDELNSSRHNGLRIVCTGSNRDKLAMLRSGKDQAFFGAPLVNFPLLGRDYVEWFCNEVKLPFSLAPAEVWPLFVEAGCRPELLGSAADQFRFALGVDMAAAPQQFADEVRRLAEELNEVARGVIHSLTPIQSAVLRVMAASDQRYAPFEAATLEKYRKAMQLSGQAPDELKVDVPGVQQALIALQEKKLVWRAARGVYAVEEKHTVDVLNAEGLLAGLH
jgi:hypothetical protein